MSTTVRDALKQMDMKFALLCGIFQGTLYAVFWIAVISLFRPDSSLRWWIVGGAFLVGFLSAIASVFEYEKTRRF